jgi:hypothetical protein
MPPKKQIIEEKSYKKDPQKIHRWSQNHPLISKEFHHTKKPENLANSICHFGKKCKTEKIFDEKPNKFPASVHSTFLQLTLK